MKKFLMMAAALLAAGSFYLMADDDGDEMRRTARVAAPSQALEETPSAALYKKECGSCHMAYQPDLLPRASWQKMMTGLESHFGTDASLDAADVVTISEYLKARAGDVRDSERHMAKIAASVSPDAPMQITRSRYFIKEHRSIPERLIVQSEVKHLANCNACHTTAEQGLYGERGIRIPNYGRWED